LALSAEGAVVVVADIAAPIATAPYPLATPEDLAQTVEMVEKEGGIAAAATVDVRDSSAVTGLVDGIVKRYGRLDILVANAGICGHSPIQDITDEMWHDTIETNLSGAFFAIRAVVPHMTRAGHGRIVAISSGAGRAGFANLGHYVASKWGLIGMVKTVALETARSGITANVVCPSTVATPMVLNDSMFRLFSPEVESPTVEDARAEFEKMSPMGVAWLEPEEISRAVMFLVTDPGHISGSVVDVNLGTSALRT
jgi:NAD(P)-dependent dehydrogenase (short-subunit alcohol dehydrogenase family)